MSTAHISLRDRLDQGVRPGVADLHIALRARSLFAAIFTQCMLTEVHVVGLHKWTVIIQTANDERLDQGYFYPIIFQGPRNNSLPDLIKMDTVL